MQVLSQSTVIQQSMFSTHLNLTEHSMNGAGHLKYKNRVNILFLGYVFKENLRFITMLGLYQYKKTLLFSHVYGNYVTNNHWQYGC
jgi:hypothetical protein